MHLIKQLVVLYIYTSYSLPCHMTQPESKSAGTKRIGCSVAVNCFISTPIDRNVLGAYT